MTGLYSDDQLNEIAEARQKWTARNKALTEECLTRTFQTRGASEYARHGLARRLRSLEHDSGRVFKLIPPDINRSPHSEAIQDATAFIQAFIANVYGAIDNFARVWCLEADIKSQKGRPIADGNIGFRPKNTDVRQTLSATFQAHLANFDGWFQYLESYRHAVAHRIPIYIPPKILSNEEAERYGKLDHEQAAATLDGNEDEFWRLFDKQRKLGVFRPYIMHSYGEGAQPVAFHGQMNIDMATVVEIGEMTFKELDTLQP